MNLLTTNDDKQICLLDLLCLITFFFSVNLSHTLQISVSIFNYTLKKNHSFMYCKWKTARLCLNFFNKFIFPDHLEVGIDVNVNVLKKYIIIRFHGTILL